MNLYHSIQVTAVAACIALIVSCGPAPTTNTQPPAAQSRVPPTVTETTVPPLPTDTPRPTSTPRPSATPTAVPEPILLTGTGDSVVDLDKWPGAGLAHITYAGGRNFAVWNYDPAGEKIDLLVNTIGAYEGVRPIDFLQDENTTRFQVESSGDWTIEVLPLSEVRREGIPSTFEGQGDDVVFISGGAPDLLMVDASAARSNIAVWAFGEGRDLLVNEIAPYTGTVIVPSGTVILVIEAEGPWTMEVTSR